MSKQLYDLMIFCVRAYEPCVLGPDVPLCGFCLYIVVVGDCVVVCVFMSVRARARMCVYVCVC